MKKKLIVLVVVLILLVVTVVTTGCAKAEAKTTKTRDMTPFEVIEEWETYYGDNNSVHVYHTILMDPDTKVLYYSAFTECMSGMRVVATESTFEVLLDADGAPKLHQ